MEHDLKIWPQYFCRVEDGSKPFEVRKNDRGFQPGDTVNLREWNPEETWKDDADDDPSGLMPVHRWKEPRGYTGKSVRKRIGYVLPIDAERVVFGLLPLEEPTP